MSLEPETLTWTALLGQWIDFARGALALPDDAAGRAWKQSVTPVIELQAVTFALGDLGRLPAHEHAVALDKANILIDRAAAALGHIWSEEPTPASVREIILDARTAHAAAVEAHRPG
jgi:hypothetical protein